MDSSPELEESLKDWADLSSEYADLELLHKLYQEKLSELLSLQKKCVSGVNHQKYRIKAVQKLLEHVSDGEGEVRAEKDELCKDILRRRAQLAQMEDVLPRPSGRYLKIILGNVNVSILDKSERFQYKDQYEQFKLVVTLISCALSFTNLFAHWNVLQLVFYFLCVWYYCTLTIRESILRVNGSRIKGWWRLHHFISTVVSGVLLVWPDGEPHRLFRGNLLFFSFYLTFVQYLQFTYQRGCLYRLRSLGQRDEMDITLDGFHSWMWKGLGFLLPILFISYAWMIYNAYVLFQLSHRFDATWHVLALALLFFVLGSGNLLTTSMIIPKKLRDWRLGLLQLRFSTKLEDYKIFWNNPKRRNSGTSISRPRSKVADKLKGEIAEEEKKQD